MPRRASKGHLSRHESWLRTVSLPAGPIQYDYQVWKMEIDPSLGRVCSLGSQVRSLTLPNAGVITNDFDLNGRLLSTGLLDSDSAILNHPKGD